MKRLTSILATALIAASLFLSFYVPASEKNSSASSSPVPPVNTKATSPSIDFFLTSYLIITYNL